MSDQNIKAKDFDLFPQPPAEDTKPISVAEAISNSEIKLSQFVSTESVAQPTLESMQKEMNEMKQVINLYGTYLKKVEYVLGFHNEHIKKLVLKDVENIGKEIGADMNPPKPEKPHVTEPDKVIKKFAEPIIELTEETMVPSNTTLIMLYTHTCPHCITLKPIYEKIAPLLIKQGIQIAAINVAHERKAAIEYQVKGVPSIRLVHNSVKHEYKGQRTEQYILDWVKSIV